MTFKVRLIPDEYHLPDVGKLQNGALFWIDVQLKPEGETVRDFVASYVFDNAGRLIWHFIEDLGLRSDSDQKPVPQAIAEHKEKLGPQTRTDIWVSPFTVEASGIIFGLVPRRLEDDEDPEENGPLVDSMPGWTIMFYPPWEEGLYDL